MKMTKTAFLSVLMISLASCQHHLSSKCPDTDLPCKGKELVRVLASSDYMDAEILFYKQGLKLSQPEEQVQQDFLMLHHRFNDHGTPPDSCYTMEERPGGHFLFQHIDIGTAADSSAPDILTLVYTDYRQHGGAAEIMGYYIRKKQAEAK